MEDYDATRVVIEWRPDLGPPGQDDVDCSLPRHGERNRRFLPSTFNQETYSLVQVFSMTLWQVCGLNPDVK